MAGVHLSGIQMVGPLSLGNTGLEGLTWFGYGNPIFRSLFAPNLIQWGSEWRKHLNSEHLLFCYLDGSLFRCPVPWYRASE